MPLCLKRVKFRLNNALTSEKIMKTTELKAVANALMVVIIWFESVLIGQDGLSANIAARYPVVLVPSTGGL